MRRCLELAGKGQGKTSPNPMVGAVVLDRRGRLVGEGWHKRAGTAHAEVLALRAAGPRAQGGTLYVNLEPCMHTGRTPPCAPMVLASGVGRVVIGMRDPWKGHGGGGRWLARRGLDVTSGVLAAEAAEQNRGFVSVARRGRPWITCKAAMTLDGKVATYGGESQWITGPRARKVGHQLRASHDAILVGIGTVLTDDPRLTTRGVRGRDPTRVVVDSRLRTPLVARLLEPSQGSRPARIIVAASQSAPRAREKALIRAGAEVWRFGQSAAGIDMAQLMARLADQRILSVLVEGGPAVHGSLMDACLIDELQLFVAPSVFGGTGQRSGLSWIAGRGTERLSNCHAFDLHTEPRQIGADVHLVLRRR